MGSDIYSQAVEYSLMVSLASHAMLGKLDEFNVEEIEEYIRNKLPEGLRDIFPREVVRKDYTKVLEIGVKLGIFVITADNKFKLTTHGKDITARWYIETGSRLVDPSRN